jgi:hypothetical protein
MLSVTVTKRARSTKSANAAGELSFIIAHAEDMAASYDMSVRHQVFTDLSTCAREEPSSGIYCFGFYLN